MPSSNLAGVIRVGRIVAIAADCNSADFGLRWFESNPAHLCLCVREVYGASPLRRCAETHRWFESTRKRSNCNTRIMVGIFCRPSLFSLVCSFEFHVTSSGVEAVHDAPFLGFKLFLILFYHSFALLQIIISIIISEMKI